MSEQKLTEIAEKADIIVAGYAFTRDDEGYIRILNLEKPDEALVLQDDGTMVETTMDDINVLKLQAYYLKNKEFLEAEHA